MPIVLSRKSGGSGGGGGAPSGPAGGSLGGTYPNPTIAAGAVDTTELANDSVEAAQIAGGAVGRSELATGIGVLDLLHDSTLGASANTFDVTGISGSYKHLRVYVTGRSTRAGQVLDFYHVRFNNDSGNNYDTNYYQGAGTSFATQESNDNSGIGSDPANASPFFVPGADSPAGGAASHVMEIPGYAGTTFFKQLTSAGYTMLADDDTRLIGGGGRWRSTTAITRITLTMINGNFLTGSRLTIYGLG